MAELDSIDTALVVLSPLFAIVQVLLHDMLIVTNAVATMEAVITSVRKPTMGVDVHALLDINPVEVHVLVCEYLDLRNVVKFR